jgi:uncharacterized protein YndB with AHSA1/START domain
MQEQPVVHSTFVIERSYPVTPDHAFEAFSDPAKKRRWFVEGEHLEVEHYEMNFQIGGTEIARFRFKEGTPVKGMACTNVTTYLDIVPNRRVVFASAMTLEKHCISASLVTVELLATRSGTDLICTYQGAFFEGSDGPQIREVGWRTLLEHLTAEFAVPQ